MAVNGNNNNIAYGLGNALQSLYPLPIIAKRAPTVSDTGEIGQQWIYNNTVWEFTSAATWTQLSGGSISFPVTIAQGGTNATSFGAVNGTVYYDGTSLVTTSAGSLGQVLTSTGVGAPHYASIDPSGTNIISFVDGNTGSPVAPVARTINVTGDGTIITTAGSGNTLSVTTAAVYTVATSSGTATASANAVTIVGGSGITTSAAGSTITITASGGSSSIYPFANVTSGTQAMAVNTGYVANNGASLVTLTLPATAAVGAVIAIQGAGSGLWTLAQNAGQTINFNEVASTVGVGGSINSTSQFDSIYVMCVTANTTWVVNQSVGNFNVI